MCYFEIDTYTFVFDTFAPQFCYEDKIRNKGEKKLKIQKRQIIKFIIESNTWISCAFWNCA